jgi:hypothetical protein
LHPEGPENPGQGRAERRLAYLAMAAVTGFGILFLMLSPERRWQSEGTRLRPGGMFQAKSAGVKPPKDLHMTGIFRAIVDIVWLVDEREPRSYF